MIRDAVFISVTIPRGRESSLGASGRFPPRGILQRVSAMVPEKERSTTGRPGGASREMGRVIAVCGWRVARGIWPFVWQNRCHALR